MAKRPTPSPGASAARDATTQQANAYQQTQGAVYIGVDAGSDLEQYGYQSNPNYHVNPALKPAMGWVAKALPRKPLYKVGYLNSKDFSRELGNMNANAIYQYQQYMNQAGMLDKYTPGQLDKATRAGFKELITRANQHAGTWQDELGSSLQAGGEVGPAKTRQPFVAQLDDPATLKETFQAAAQQVYGGDLPDAEVNAMVDAYRQTQAQRQQAAYSAQDTGGTVDNEPSAQAFALSKIKEQHPDQVNRVKFADTLGTIMQTFSSGAPK